MTSWRLLVVDDEEAIAEQTKELLDNSLSEEFGEAPEIVVETSFASALTRLADGRYDLLVLDVRDQSAEDGEPDPDTGVVAFEQIRERQFVPVVFYTALPSRVENLESRPFVGVVSKVDDDSITALRRAVAEAFRSWLPAINRGLQEHVERVTRDFMIDFVEQHWTDLQPESRLGDVAHLLLRRLALSLAEGGHVLAAALGDANVELSPSTVHPMRFYVIPPVAEYMTGDVLLGPRIVPVATPSEAADTAKQGPAEPVWYVVLTPACDLVGSRVKAEFVVLAECLSLDAFPEVQDWRDAVTKLNPNDATSTKAIQNAENRLRRLLRNNGEGRQADRFHYLPSAWDVPDLLVDLQRVVHVRHSDLERYDRKATLDSPYAESLVAQFGRYIGRLGTPDLDTDVIVTKLRPN